MISIFSVKAQQPVTEFLKNNLTEHTQLLVKMKLRRQRSFLTHVLCCGAYEWWHRGVVWWGGSGLNKINQNSTSTNIYKKN